MDISILIVTVSTKKLKKNHFLNIINYGTLRVDDKKETEDYKRCHGVK